MSQHLILTLADQPTLLNWAGPRCSPAGNPWDWGRDAVAMGVLEQETGRVVAVMVANAFFDQSANIHIASDGGRSWATRRILSGIFHYLFIAHDLQRVVASADHTNSPSISFMVKLGFSIEARLRMCADGSRAKIVATMFRDECHWLEKDG